MFVYQIISIKIMLIISAGVYLCVAFSNCILHLIQSTCPIDDTEECIVFRFIDLWCLCRPSPPCPLRCPSVMSPTPTNSWRRTRVCLWGTSTRSPSPRKMWTPFSVAMESLPAYPCTRDMRLFSSPTLPMHGGRSCSRTGRCTPVKVWVRGSFCRLFVLS